MQWVDRIGSRLKLRDLHILLAVVQQGSMAKAAAQLSISQPAVSKRLQTWSKLSVCVCSTEAAAASNQPPMVVP